MTIIKLKTACLFTLAGVGLFTSCMNTNKTRPQRRDMVDAVFASGNVISSNEFSVTASAEGYLVESFVSEGDTLKPGARLFRIENQMQAAEVNSAFASYQYALSKSSENSPIIQQQTLLISQAKEQVRIDSINYLRYQNLVKSNAVSKTEYDRALLQYTNSMNNLLIQKKSLADLKMTLALNVTTAKNELTTQNEKNSFYWLYTSSSATVLNVYKKNGDLVKKGETVARLGSGRLLCRLLISEDDIQRVITSMKVLVALNTEKDKVYTAHISKVYPSFDEQQQSFIAEAVFETLPNNLKHNTQLQANILLAENKDALVIPTNYITDANKIMRDGQILPVKTGIRTMEWIEITEGLSDDDEIELPK